MSKALTVENLSSHLHLGVAILAVKVINYIHLPFFLIKL